MAGYTKAGRDLQMPRDGLMQAEQLATREACKTLLWGPARKEQPVELPPPKAYRPRQIFVRSFWLCLVSHCHIQALPQLVGCQPLAWTLMILMSVTRMRAFSGSLIDRACQSLRQGRRLSRVPAAADALEADGGVEALLGCRLSYQSRVPRTLARST
jgi:hypothetical protein